MKENLELLWNQLFSRDREVVKMALKGMMGRWKSKGGSRAEVDADEG